VPAVSGDYTPGQPHGSRADLTDAQDLGKSGQPSADTPCAAGSILGMSKYPAPLTEGAPPHESRAGTVPKPSQPSRQASCASQLLPAPPRGLLAPEPNG
jgi:hypothetical protein